RQRQRDAESRVRGAGKNARAPASEAAGSVHALEVEDVEIAVALFRRSGKARKQFVLHHSHIVGAAHIEGIEGADSRFGGARVVALRPARDQANGAADGVFAEQRALRAAQNLDSFEVEQIEDGALRPAEVDVVDVYRHA